MSDDSKCRVCWGDNLYCQDVEESAIIEGIFSEGDHVLVHAKKGVGKSVTAMQMMANLTMGQPFLDVYQIPKKFNVAYCQGESTHKKFDKRIINMKKAVEVDDDRRAFLTCRRMGLNYEDDMKMLVRKLKEPGKKWDVIIFDSLYNFVRGSKRNDDVAQSWVNNVDYILNQFGAAGITLGHMGKDSLFQAKGGVETVSKGGSAYGAVEWDAAFTIIYELKEINKKHKIMRLIKHKDRDGECIDEVTFKMIIPQKDPQGRLLLTVHDEDLDNNQFVLSSFLKRNEGNKYTADQVCEELKMQRSSFFYAIKHLVSSGLVIKEKGEGRQIMYSSMVNI